MRYSLLREKDPLGGAGHQNLTDQTRYAKMRDMEKIQVKLKTKKKPYTHKGVTGMEKNEKGNLTLHFGEGMADVIYPHTIWDRLEHGI